MAFTALTQEDKNELLGAYTERFRLGEIGPLTFRDLAERIGISKEDIDAIRNKYVDECADNMRAKQ